MWYVKTKEGALELAHNLASAKYYAKQYGTVVVDGWTGREYEA